MLNSPSQFIKFTSLVLYIAKPHPPVSGKLNTSVLVSLAPLVGVKTTSNLPPSLTTKSLALYWSPTNKVLTLVKE